jgi:methionyl-tRNA formyltransferase
MRLIVMGTGPFAVPVFEALLATDHEVVVLVTQPLGAPRGSRSPAVSPMRQAAQAHGTPIFDPEDVNAESTRARLATYDADLLVVCDYGQILSPETLATARLGGINAHGSLLPKYRGAAPVNWAIYHGESETGVSIIHMTPRVDAGPVIAQAATPIDPEETAEQLEARLAEMGAWLARRAIDSLESGRLEALPQDPSQASKAPRLKKTDGLIDWSRPAVDVKNHVRAVQPWPKAYTFWHRSEDDRLRLIVGPLKVVESPDAAPGTVLEAAGDRLIVATGQGAARLTEVQPAGKRMLTPAEFLRGYRVQPGDRFGP